MSAARAITTLLRLPECRHEEGSLRACLGAAWHTHQASDRGPDSCVVARHAGRLVADSARLSIDRPGALWNEATCGEMRRIGEQFVCSVADELAAAML